MADHRDPSGGCSDAMTYHCLSGSSALVASAFFSCRTVSFFLSSTDRSFLWRFQINTLVCNVWQPELAVIALTQLDYGVLAGRSRVCFCCDHWWRCRPCRMQIPCIDWPSRQLSCTVSLSCTESPHVFEMLERWCWNRGFRQFQVRT